MSSFWQSGIKALWSSGGACGNSAAGCSRPQEEKRRSAPVQRPAAHSGDDAIAEAHAENVDPLVSYKVDEPGLHNSHPYISDDILSKAIDSMSGQRNDASDAEEAKREAARLREALQRAEEKLANSASAAKENSPNRYHVPVEAHVATNQQMIFPVLDKPITAPQLDLTCTTSSAAYGQSAVPALDKLSITSPPKLQQTNSNARGSRAVPVEVQVEMISTAPAASLRHCGSMLADEACWRVRHVRCDNAKMPTALRARPSGKEPPLKEEIVEPQEEVVVLDSCSDPKNPNDIWTRVSCAKGEGWMKRIHLKEGGWRMRHVRVDNANIPTALRERPTATAKPLQAVKAEAHEEVVLHVQQEVQEGGRSTTWARIACQAGEGWLKREHLKEVLPPGPKIEELPDEATSPSSPHSPMASTLPGGSLANSQIVPLRSAVMSHISPTSPTSRSSPMQSKMSTVSDGADATSEYPASSIRIRLGMLEFVSDSVGAIGMFDQVTFRVAVQLGSSAAKRWLDNGPHTETRTMKYGRSISNEGRYEAKFCCSFDEALDLSWPPPDPLVDKIAVDIYIERVTVADHLDRVLGNLGLHRPADTDRRWLGRALADLPPEGVDDLPFAWPVEACRLENAPVPQTMSVGVEWVYDPIEKI
jgi:hypothetical protein